MINITPWRLLMQQSAGGGGAGPITLIDYGGWMCPAEGTGVTITGIQSGDLVIICGASDSEDMTVPSGWTTGYINNASGTSAHGGFIYTFATSSSLTVSGLAGTGSGGFSYGYIWQVFRGVNQSTPINAQAGVGSGGGGMPDPPSITTDADGCMIVAMGMLDDDEVASTVNPPTDFTLIYAQNSDRYATCMSAYLLQETAGSINPDAFTSTGGNDNRIAITVALNPI